MNSAPIPRSGVSVRYTSRRNRGRPRRTWTARHTRRWNKPETTYNL